MKLKIKLYALAITAIFSIFLSIGVFMSFQNLTNRMIKEQHELIALRDLMFRQNITMSNMINNKSPLIIQRGLLDDNIKKTNIVLENVKGLKVLPGLNSKTEKAFKSISNLDTLLKNSYSKLTASLDSYMKLFDKTDTAYSIKGVALYKNKKNYNEIRLTANRVVDYSYTVEIALDAASNILSKQSDVVDSVITSYQQFVRIISLIVVGISVIGTGLFAFLLSNSISRSLSVLTNGLTLMASGDFTHDIIINSKDELGKLGDEMNRFQGDLNESLNQIKGSSKENKEANIGLIETTADASDVTVDISNSIESVAQQIHNLDNSINQTNISIGGIFDFTNKLNGFTSEQMAMVEKSTAAITQMIASISSISSLTKNNSTTIKDLEITAVEGDKKLTDTTEIIEDIYSTVNEINNMSEIIKSISEQTNLLAMNAAIEAAHAGDAGKGFAVVADEIRKLAEASAMNSQDISKNLNEIISKIEKASIFGQSTRKAFTDINDKIKNISHALLQVSFSTTELDSGGSQVLAAMESLKDISITVQGKSSEMKEISSGVNSLSGNISDISKSVTESVLGVRIGFEEVTNAMVSLNDVSDRVEAVSKVIDIEVSKFKTK